MENKIITFEEVLDKLKTAKEKEKYDTDYSKKIFNVEEGEEDKEIKEGKKSKSYRRDWLVIADIYCNNEHEKYSQHFHLENYIQFKLKNGSSLGDNFKTKCYRYFRNIALILYIREEIFGESKEKLEPLYKKAKKYYKNKENQINNVKFAAKMRIG